MSTSFKDTNDVASLLLLQGSQRPFSGLNLSVPNGLLVQFRREVAQGGPRPVGTGAGVPDRKCLRCVCASRSVLAAAGRVGETVLPSAWSRNSSSAPGPVPLRRNVPHHHRHRRCDPGPAGRVHSGRGWKVKERRGSGADWKDLFRRFCLQTVPSGPAQILLQRVTLILRW